MRNSKLCIILTKWYNWEIVINVILKIERLIHVGTLFVFFANGSLVIGQMDYSNFKDANFSLFNINFLNFMF